MNPPADEKVIDVGLTYKNGIGEVGRIAEKMQEPHSLIDEMKRTYGLKGQNYFEEQV